MDSSLPSALGVYSAFTLAVVLLIVVQPTKSFQLRAMQILSAMLCAGSVVAMAVAAGNHVVPVAVLSGLVALCAATAWFYSWIRLAARSRQHRQFEAARVSGHNSGS